MANSTPPSFRDILAHASEALRQVGQDARRTLRQASQDARRTLRQFEGAELTQALNRLGSYIASEAFREGLRRFQGLLDEAIPPNWRWLVHTRTGEDQLERVVELMRETGWSLARTPPASVLRDLLDAADLESREEILLQAEAEIMADLDRQLRENDSPRFPDLHAAGVEALASYASGYFLASQALSTAAITSAIQNHFGLVGFKSARETLGEFSDERGFRVFRLASVMGALGTAIDGWWHKDPPRRNFNRHNSAHSLGEPQYRQVNALTALMLLVSIEVELEIIAEEITSSDS